MSSEGTFRTDGGALKGATSGLDTSSEEVLSAIKDVSAGSKSFCCFEIVKEGKQEKVVLLEGGDDAGKDGLLKYLEGVSDKVVFGSVNLGKVYGFVV